MNKLPLMEGISCGSVDNNLLRKRRSDMTPDERRAYQAAYMRRYRQRQKEAERGKMRTVGGFSLSTDSDAPDMPMGNFGDFKYTDLFQQTDLECLLRAANIPSLEILPGGVVFPKEECMESPDHELDVPNPASRQSSTGLSLSCSSPKKGDCGNMELQKLLERRPWCTVTVDIVDLSKRPDGEFNHVFHATDENTKYSWAAALKTDKSEDITKALVQMLCTFGAPHHLRIDQSFKCSLLEDALQRQWPSIQLHYMTGGKILNNGTLASRRREASIKERILMWLIENDRAGWVDALLEIKFAHNSEIIDEAEATPMEMFFDRSGLLCRCTLDHAEEFSMASDVNESV